MGESCELVVTLTEGKYKGETSALHQELLDKYSRPVANYVYASYLSNGVAERMRSKGYRLGRRGEHKASDVVTFLGIQGLLTNKQTLTGDIEKYDTAEQALKAANDFNSNPDRKGVVAEVVYNENEEHLGEYIVRRVVKDSLNILQVRDTMYKGLLRSKSLETFGAKALESSLLNTKEISLENVLDSIARLKFRDVKYLNDEQLEFLATQLDPDSAFYNRINNSNVKGGTIAEKLYTIINDDFIGSELKKAVFEELTKLKEATSKKAEDIKIDALEEANAWERSKGFKDSAVVKKILELEDAFRINEITFTKVNAEVKSLQDVYIEAISGIERKLRNIDLNQEDEINDSLDIKDMLMEELLEKQHVDGLLTFVKDANNRVKEIQEKLKNLTENIEATEPLENLTAYAEVIQEAKDFITIYKNIAEFLSVLGEGGNDLDVSLSLTDKEALRSLGKELRDAISGFEINILDRKETSLLLSLVRNYLGEEAFNSLGEANVAMLLSQRGSFLNRLFKSVNNSNSVIAALSVLIRDQQHKRDEELNTIALRIAAADRKLKNAGYTNDFIIDRSTGYIKSNIDWEEYNKDKYKAIGKLKAAGYSGLELRVRLKSWEDRNCEDIVVDKKTGRTEKLPNAKYRTQLDFMARWSDAQIDYYNEIMDLKGELGTMLPEEAQHQYLPPQLRKTNLSTVDDAIKGKISSKEAFTVIWDRIAHPFKIREDDREHNKNGIIINGETYASSFSDFDSTELNKIPVFYINKIKDQNELEENFSRSLVHLASTAVNYKYMEQIQDLAEYIKDEFNGLYPVDNTKVDSFLGRAKQYSIRIIHNITNRDTSNTDIVNALVERQLYGKSSEKADKLWSRVLRKLTSLNSIRVLGLNVKGAVSNILQGEYQMLIEASATNEFFNLKDWAWATTQVFGDSTLGIPSALNDLSTGVRTNKAKLFEDIFNPQQENYGELINRRFYNSRIRNIVGSMDSIPLYSLGESLMAKKIMYAVLHNQKVLQKKDGKFVEISLYDAFEIKDSEDGINKSLVLKNDVYSLSGQKIDTTYIRDIKKKIGKIKQDLLGAMNNEDKGVIYHNDVARAAMSFRQWMVGYLERRFRGKHIAGDMGELNETYFHNNYYALLNGKKVPLKEIIYLTTDELGQVTFKIKEGAKTLDGEEYTMEQYTFDREEAIKLQNIRVGYWTDTFFVVKDMYRDIIKEHLSVAASWKLMNSRQKANVKRTLSELSMFISMSVLFGILDLDDEEEDKEKSWWGRFWTYQARRIQHDALFGIPVGMPYEMLRIAKSPFPQFGTIDDLYYPISGLIQGHHKETLGPSSPDAGENKYWRNIKKEVLKFPYDIEKLIRMDEDQLNVFNSSSY
jgi:hypothetical protein